MATKKTEKVAAKAAEVKPVVAQAEVKPVEKKVEVKAEVKAEKKVAEKKTPAKKAVAEKKAPAKKAVKKAELKAEVFVQFAGKSYAQDDFMKMAKDVWKYDLKQKAADLTSIELYVKPEENMVYYVMNKEFTGSFYI